MTEETRIYNEEKTASSTSGSRKTGKLHAKKKKKKWTATCMRMCLDPYITLYTKVNSKWIKVVNGRPETIKLQKKAEAVSSLT